MSYFVAKIVFPLKFEKKLGVDLGSELVPVDLVTEWTVNDVASAILVGESCTIALAQDKFVSSRSAFPFEIRELCSLKDQSKYLLPATCGVNILLEEV